jgi:hypothetical protein
MQVGYPESSNSVTTKLKSTAFLGGFNSFSVAIKMLITNSSEYYTFFWDHGAISFGRQAQTFQYKLLMHRWLRSYMEPHSTRL